MPIRRGRFAPQNTFLETIAQKFDHGNSNFVLGSAQEKNNYPIVYCSDGFCELTGFSRSDLMRRSCACNFLYGLDSNREDIQSIETALRSQKELKKEILFYKKNGSPFHCLLDIVPIKNEKGNVVLFLVSHKDVTTRKLSNEVHGDEQASANGGTQQKLSRTKTRKFSRDVLLHLSRQYQQNNNTSKTTATRSFKRSRSFSFTSERLPQYKRESTKKSKFLFLHYSTEKGLWDWWILVLTFYIAIMVPYNVAFSRHGKARDLIIVDMVIELFFILDIVVHFRTTFVNHAGRIVYEQKAIAIHYLKGWFVLDFLAALPFEALYFINQSWGFLVQLLKCGRLLRLFRVVRKLHRYTEYSTVLLTLLMLAFAMVAHWLACVWYVIGLEEVRDNSTVSWLYQFGEIIERPFVDFALDTGPDEGSAYVTALYFTLTSMTTVGFGNVSANTNAEKAFAVIVMLIGALMHAAIFGNVAAIIQKLYANRVRYHSRANEIKQFIRVHHIDGDLANRLEDYFHTTWSLSGGVDTREILSTFPNEIQSDVCMHLYKGFLELPLFNQAPRGLVRMLSLNVRPVYVGPGEYLLMQNDVINCIYYIASGSMEVLQGESVAAILGKGDLFGEDISRKGPIRKSNGDVRALTYCDIYFITRDLVQEVLHLYPDYAFKFSEKLELTYDLGASERDIWRRGGLDSISEDEEENDDDTSDSLETGSDVISTVRNRLDMKTSRATRTNNFTPNEPWRFYPRPKIRGFDFNEKEPLLSVPCEEVPSVSKINVLHPSNKQFSLSKESNVSNNEIDGADDAYLEWEPEPFILTQNDDAHKSSDEELNGIVVDSINTDNCNDNLEFREIENSSPRPTKSYKRAKDSFLKQLRSSAEDREHRNSIKTSNEYDDESDVEKGRADSFGLTEFVTPSQSPSLGMKRRSPNVSPAHSLNSNKSYRSRKSRSSLQRLEFPIAEGLQDNQIPYINECNQIPRQDSTRRNLSPSPAVDSPCFSIGRLFALTPPPIDDNDSPYGIHYASMPSSPARKKETGSSKSLRRNATADFISPASSCGGLSDDPRSTPNRRMRKMSTASAPPPSVFASLVAQASKSPYADFVPPTIVRESTITCNCDEEESCSICGDKESTQRPADDNMSSNESLDLVKTQKHKDSNTSVESNTTISDSEIAHKDFHLKKPKCSSQVSIKYLFGSFSSSCSAEQNALNVDDNQDFAEELSDRLLRRKRQLTRETAVYSSASQGDDDDSNRSTNSGKKTERDSNLYRMSWTSNSLDGLDKSTHSDDSEDAEDVRKVNVVKEDSVDDNIGAEIDFTTISEGNNSVRKRTVIENREIRNFPEPCLDERKRKEIDLPITSDDTSYPKQYQNENTQTDVDISAITEDAITTVTCLYKETEDDLGSSSKQPTASYIAHTETSPMPQQLQLETNDAKGPPLSHKNNRIPTFSCDRSTQSSLSSLSSQHMAALQYGTSLTDVSTNSTDNFINDIGGIGDTYHKQKPTTSGIHSTHSLNDLSNSGRAFAAAHILSYSEPQLQRPKTNAKHDDEGDIFNDDELEDIFKDVANAKQAMERLQMILSSPEPTLTSDLADTKETVQRLDQQVLTLNQDLASLRGDVKMVLELLKGLKNGQVGSNT